MVVTQKTNRGKILSLVTDPPFRYISSSITAKDQICDEAVISNNNLSDMKQYGAD